MKPLAQAKHRLAGLLTQEQRQALCLSMLARVLVSANSASPTDEVRVVGGDDSIRNLCLALEASWSPEPGKDLNDSLARAFDQAFSEGANAVLFLPGDLPLLTARALEGLVLASKGLGRAVLAPARDGGTNALLLPRGPAFAPLLGPSSFQRHMEALARAGYSAVEHSDPDLSFDLDTAEDWERLKTLCPELIQMLPHWTTLQQRLSVGTTDIRSDVMDALTCN